MSKSHNKIFACAILSALFAGALPRICKAQNPPQELNDQETVLSRTHDFLSIFYQELLGKDSLLAIRTMQSMDHSWRRIYGIEFDVRPYDPHSERMLNPPFDAKTGKRILAPDNSPLVKGLIFFDRAGRLDQLDVAGPIVQTERYNSLRELVEAHPEWSEEQALVALNEAGAHFGPANKEELLKKIQLQKFEPFLGRFTIKSVEFNGLGEVHEGNFAKLYWTVLLEVELPKGAHTTYWLGFEPFEGRVTQVGHILAGHSEEPLSNRKH